MATTCFFLLLVCKSVSAFPQTPSGCYTAPHDSRLEASRNRLEADHRIIILALRSWLRLIDVGASSVFPTDLNRGKKPEHRDHRSPDE
ncbi:hypothetical protein EYF80_041785 [Liparis tanakae]|uniref:Secreted protein n=1 Tax=Liparis tanakae TaxID=230148 RepID=A0A4Z2G547_9TELE|nr:hypothetical protein EYF80_041785 [Liparis tanakae]